MHSPSKVTAVILAGGKGTRLRSIISDRPKVLAEIRERPFITYLLEQLIVTGIKNVVLCTGFMADKVYEELNSTYKLLNLIYSRESEPLGTGGALRHALPDINSDLILVMNGDSFANVDLSKYLDWFYKMNCQASILLTKVPDTGRYGRVEMDESGMISSFKEKGEDTRPGWINAGIYILEKSMLLSVPTGKPFSLEREFFPEIVGKGLYGYRSSGEFIDIGTPETYLLAKKLFRKISL